MQKIALAQRVQKIKTSPTIAISSLAAKLKAQGKNIISLGVGEPDFDTPEYIKAAAIQAIQNGQTKYTAVDGTVALKKAVQGKFQRENNLEYNLNQILVSCGAKQSIYNLTQALLEAGDEVIIPGPYWVSYPDMCLLADAEPVFINTDSRAQYKITAEQLEAAITPRTKLLILNSPSNPSGQYYTKTELSALAQVLLKHPQVYIVSDDIYEHMLWAEHYFYNIVMVCPELASRTVVVNGVSKAYAMTGWRIGYAAGPLELIQEMEKIQSQSTSCPCSVSQAAATAALNGSLDFAKEMAKSFKIRHDMVVEKLNTLPGVKCLPSSGTFYSFFDASDLINQSSKVADDVELAAFLLDTAEVALVPGGSFGNPNHLRLSFAASEKNLQEALARMQKFLPQLLA